MLGLAVAEGFRVWLLFVVLLLTVLAYGQYLSVCMAGMCAVLVCFASDWSGFGGSFKGFLGGLCKHGGYSSFDGGLDVEGLLPEGFATVASIFMGSCSFGPAVA